MLREIEQNKESVVFNTKEGDTSQKATMMLEAVIDVTYITGKKLLYKIH